MDRVGRLKLVLWMLVGLGAAVATARFLFGLGGNHPPVGRHPLGFVGRL